MTPHAVATWHLRHMRMPEMPERDFLDNQPSKGGTSRASAGGIRATAPPCSATDALFACSDPPPCALPRARARRIFAATLHCSFSNFGVVCGSSPHCALVARRASPVQTSSKRVAARHSRAGTLDAIAGYVTVRFRRRVLWRPGGAAPVWALAPAGRSASLTDRTDGTERYRA